MTEEDKAKVEQLLVRKLAGALVDTLLAFIAFGLVLWVGGPLWGALATGLIVFMLSGVEDRVREELTGEEAVRLWFDLRRERKKDERAREQGQLARKVLDCLPESAWVDSHLLAARVFGDEERAPDLFPTLPGLVRDGLVESRDKPGDEGLPLRRRQYRRVP